MKYLNIAIIIFCIYSHSTAQENLLNLIDEDEQNFYAQSEFKSIRLVSGQSTRTPYAGDLIFLISHRFGRLNSGAYEFFGLDQATIRLGFEYSPLNGIALGIGRSSYNKAYDAYFKVKVLEQQDNSIASLTLSSSLAYLSIKNNGLEEIISSKHRLQYATLLMISSRINSWLSVQLTPSYVHKNLVSTEKDPNDYFLLGSAASLKLSNRISFNLEHFFLINKPKSTNLENSLSIGFDIETGGHVFQLHISNSQAFYDSGLLTETTGRWLNGDIHFGFHIIRTFKMRRTKAKS